MTPLEALQLKPGQVIYSTTLTNADGSPVRARCSGKPRTFVRTPNNWYVPLKYGLRTSFRLSTSNINDWSITP